MASRTRRALSLGTVGTQLGRKDGLAVSDSSRGVKQEYRVIWQREGCSKRRVIYQTLAGAKECAKRQRTAAEDIDWLSSPIPELVFGPNIESRDVGEWQV